MQEPEKLTREERYQRAIEALIRFDFARREEDLRWMLQEARRPVRGMSWLKTQYYELLRKCEAFPAPFQLVYDLETIAGRIFPGAARKSTFLRNPIKEYFKIRLKQYSLPIKELLSAETITLSDLLPLLREMEQKDGQSMVRLFLAELRARKIHTQLSDRMDRTELEHALRCLSANANEQENEKGHVDLDAAIEKAIADAAASVPASVPADLQEIEPELQDAPLESAQAGDSFETEAGEPQADSLAAPQLDFLESAFAEPGGPQDGQSAFTIESDQGGVSGDQAPEPEFEMPHNDLEDPGELPAEPHALYQEEPASHALRDLRSDEAYKEFLLEEQTHAAEKKAGFLEDSGLNARVERAASEPDQRACVQLLAELHPLAFLSPQEKLLRGLDRIESPLGRIMAHLSLMRRRLNVPDMRAYVDYYAAELDRAGVFENFPAIRERLINYRNSLIDPPPELLRQVHEGLRTIEEESGGDHRACIESQVMFLKACLASEVYGRVWPTILVILENLIGAELAGLGEKRPVSWKETLESEMRTEPGPLREILSEVEPESAESVAAVSAAARIPQNGGQDLLARRTGDPGEDRKRIAEVISALFVRDSAQALQLAADVLNAPEYSLAEKHGALESLQEQNLPHASELARFHTAVYRAGGSAQQKACVASLRKDFAAEIADAASAGIALEEAQNQSVGRLHEFLMSKDNAARSLIFQEIRQSPHIPEGMKAVFRKGADAGIVDRCMNGIATSSLSSANKLKLLRILKTMAVHRGWLLPPVEDRLNKKIQFYERIVTGDQKLQLELSRAHDAKAADTGETQAEAAEESRRQGLSDEFLDSLIQNRMRAARWYARLPDYAREELHKQAALPGKARTLLGQITKDNAFKKAVRHLKSPVDPAVLEKISEEFPEPQYQESLKKFRKARSAKVEPSVASAAQAPQEVSLPVSDAIAPVQLDPGFERLLDQAILSGPGIESIPADESLGTFSIGRAPNARENPGHPAPETQTSIPASRTSVPRQAESRQADSRHTEVRHAEARHEPRHSEKEESGVVEGMAASLARGFTSLFSKSSSPARTQEKKSPPAAGGKAHERKKPPKKSNAAASVLMKAVAGHSKGEVYLREEDFKQLEKEMAKHPDSRKLMDDHAYIFQLDHPDPSQFQPPWFLIIPELKALNHDPAKKKLAMEKIEKAISTAPAKKKPHLQALLTFMERYKTR